MSSGAQPADKPRPGGKTDNHRVSDYKSELDRRAWEASEALRQKKEGGGVGSSMMTTVSKLVEQVTQIVPEGKKMLGLEESNSTGNESSSGSNSTGNSVGSNSSNSNSSSSTTTSNNTETTAPSQQEISDAAVEAFLRDVHGSGIGNRRKQKKETPKN